MLLSQTRTGQDKYMAENAYVIIRADNHICTFSMDKVRLEIN